MVMVFLKTILASLTTLITQASNNGNAGGLNFVENQNGVNNGATNENASSYLETSKLSLEELDGIRTQEITAKTASGLILLMLKWFKVSRMARSDH
jgi:hypothetical protein